MDDRRLYRLLIAGLCASVLSCAGPAGNTSTRDGVSRAGQAQATKRVALMIKAEPSVLAGELSATGGGFPMGTAEVTGFAQDGLSVVNTQGVRVPAVASTLPSVENGLWKVFPDGRMEMTWKLNPNVRWHDGIPFTSGDLFFTLRMKQELAPFSTQALLKYVEGATAPDAQTIVVSWKSTFIDANELFSEIAWPVPRHVLEQPYSRGDDPAFMNLPYWSDQFIGVGPFKVKEWNRGAYWLLVANDDYYRGRPKIDEVKLIFVNQPPAMMANLLAGNAHVSTQNLNVPLETAIDMRDRWPEGNVTFLSERSFFAWPQFINSTPPILSTSVEFRRVWYYALDRQTIGEGFNLGLPTEVAHAFGGRYEPTWAQMTAAVPHYDYDPRRAAQMMADLGFTKGSDGLYRFPSGEILKSEMRTTENVDTRVAQALASEWQRFGMQMDFVIIPAARQSDREYRGTFPGFLYTGNTGGDPVDRLVMMHSEQTPLPESNFGGRNTNRMSNPQLDNLVTRIGNTIPDKERYDLAAQAQKIIFDQVGVYVLWYQQDSGLFAHKNIQNISYPAPLWNIHEWDLSGPV